MNDSYNFWETKFQSEQTNWGFEPSDSAIITKDFFLKKHINNILIPGIGYGRNAHIFLSNGINVTGIEISKTAIDLAYRNGLSIMIHHGSVTSMPFDEVQYEGIFCYALIHLFNRYERRKFLKACYDQLKPDGYMIFVVVSKAASTFGEGRKIGNNRFELSKGLKVFYYDLDSAKQEFSDYGLSECYEMDEPIKFMVNEPPLKCIYLKCCKSQIYEKDKKKRLS